MTSYFSNSRRQVPLLPSPAGAHVRSSVKVGMVVSVFGQIHALECPRGDTAFNMLCRCRNWLVVYRQVRNEQLSYWREVIGN